MPNVTLTVTRYAGEPLEGGDSKVFDERGGTIGRGSACDWILADPNRFLSSRHAALTFEDGRFLLIDTSTNGVFINHSREPLGSDLVVPLTDGDVITLGDYELSVSLHAAPAAKPRPAAAMLGDAGDIPDPLELLSGTAPPSARTAGWPQTAAEPQPLDSLAPAAPTRLAPRYEQAFTPPQNHEAVDPLALLDGDPSATTVPGDFDAALPYSHRDDAPAMSGAFQPPAASLIPDDWDDLLAPEVQSAAALPVAERAPRRPVPRPAPETPHRRSGPVAPPTPLAATDAFDAFVRGLGTDPQLAEGAVPEQTLELAGRLFRLTMDGLREIMMARASLKSGFRMDVTYVAPANNNPLKFAAGGADELIEKLLFKRSRGYLGPVEAIEEAFRDIGSHQVAMVAGLRAGFEALMKQFDPAALERRFDTAGKRGGLLKNKNALNWEEYCEWYAELTKDPDEAYTLLFGEAFAEAYEFQARQAVGGRGA